MGNVLLLRKQDSAPARGARQHLQRRHGPRIPPPASLAVCAIDWRGRHALATLAVTARGRRRSPPHRRMRIAPTTGGLVVAEQTAERPAYTAQYPRSVRLGDGSEVTLRLMTQADRDAVLRFARSLPADDLLFLRTDITDPAVVDEWVSNLDKRTVTVLAEGQKGEGILGYGS